ncbi:MAG: S9 family peptidase [Alphaproteobacteria bacterium]|nr:S9 family peptidase [Alphaproteobacteria bacterium]
MIPGPTLATPDDDPFLWLEEIEGERAVAWVEARSAETLARHAGPATLADRDALAAILDRADKLPSIARRGSWIWNFWQDAANPRGLWRRTTLASFRTEKPDWDVVLDLDALAAREGADWIWQGASTLPPDHDRAILRLSRGGGDAVVLREFDIAAREFVAGGFELSEAKGGIDWIDRDTLLLSSAFGGPEMTTDAGYSRTIRLWRRGADPARLPVLFETTPAAMGAWGWVDRVDRGRLWFAEKPGFFEQRLWLGDAAGRRERLDLPEDVSVAIEGDWLAVKRRSDWTIGERTWPADTLLGISLGAYRAGDRGFAPLYEPGPRRALEEFFWNRGTLIVASLDELLPVFERHIPAASGPWRRERLTQLPPQGVVDVGRLDIEADEGAGELLVTAQDPLTPPTLMLLSDALAAPEILKRSSAVFAAQGLVVTQHQATSVDGERIPYTQIGPATARGDAPVHLTAYGGFAIAMRPSYGSAIGKLWLERGGTHVIANIRGGGEFGTRWHEAGRREGKFLAHEDFAAVAADLVRRGVTTPARIAAEGGSNGGLLIANMLVRHPGKFGALFCTIPLIDMRRYSKLLAGASWIAEYGDPDRPEDWAFLQRISAYHLAEPGRAYPPILIATTRRDDRVHPGHARKMAARLRALGHRVQLYEPAAGGHGYGKDNRERALFTALGLAFLREAIGWPEPGDAAAASAPR